MKYTEYMKCKKSQIRKNMKWADVAGAQICVKTQNGHFWLGNREVTDKKELEKLHIVDVCSYQVTMYLVEKATMNGMKGVRIRIFGEIITKAKRSYSIPSESLWMFVSNDWKSYDMDGNPIKINDVRRNCDKAPHYYVIDNMKNYGLDLRAVGEARCACFMSPATVEILKEAGFDMGHEIPLSYCVGRYYGTISCPEDSYLTGWFIDNLIHPNRIKMRRRELERAPSSYDSLKSAMGDKKFAVLKLGGQPFVAIKHDKRIVTSPILIRGEKDPGCWIYDDRGSKKLRSYDDVCLPYVNWYYGINANPAARDISVNAIEELLGNRPILEETDVFPNLIPALESALLYLKSFPEEALSEALPRAIREKIGSIYNKLSYLIKPQGQKDKTFEQSIKEAGLAGAITVNEFLRGNHMEGSKLHMDRKTPYGQADLPKSVYYELKRLNESGKAVSLGEIICGITRTQDCGYGYNDSGREFDRAKAEFFACMPQDFIEKVSESLPQRFDRLGTGTFGCCTNREFWMTLVNFGGCASTDPIPAKIKAVERMLAKLKTDYGLLHALENWDTRDYFRQINELAPLGLNWPRKYDEFRMSNVMWFLGTIRSHQVSINNLKSEARKCSGIDDVISLLHTIQNELCAEQRRKLAAEADEQLDKMYSSWREKLRKALAWKGDDLGIFVPEHLSELTYEGSELHHCVGSYKRDVAQGLEGILFLRKLSSPDVPYYTIDVVKGEDGKYRVRQCHGKCNCQPTPEIIDALDKWADDTGNVDAHSIKDSYGALCAL